MANVLQNAGTFEILTPLEALREQLLNIERAGRTCYQSEKEEITLESAAAFVRKLIRRGHGSVLEHSLIVVKFLHCSRGFTHEMVRHRHTGYSQESTRYVDYDDQITIVGPGHRNLQKGIPLEDGSTWTFEQMAAQIEMFYKGLRNANWVPQDARQILPIGLESDIVVSTSFRQWRNIFELRTTKPAHWEIRQVMGNLLVELQGILPGVFDDFVEAGVDGNQVRYFKKVEG